MAYRSTRSFAMLGTGSAFAAIAIALLPGSALAQAAETAAEPDIVVTAQKREQRLQDVGVSATVLSEATLTRLNVANATDVARAIPNLKYNAYSSSQVVFNVRGVSQNDYGDQQEPPVAVYQDDSYASSINTASFPVFDLARVEALRGPQGTLFGRNATGGAVQFISNQPTREFGGYVAATYGRYNQTIVEGALSGPLGEAAAFRIAGILDRDDGFIKNLVPGFKDLGANNHWALRGILALEPSSDFKARLTLRYAKADKERQAGLYSSEPACPNAQYQGEFEPVGVTCAYWVNFEVGNPGPGTTATGYRNDAITPSRGGNPWATEETSPSYVNRTLFGATLRLDYAFGNVDLVSVTDYQTLDKFYTEGGDASPDLGVVFFQGAKSHQVSQELRVSTKLGAAYLVAGAYGMIIDGDYTGKFASPFYGYDPSVAFSQRTESLALFAQGEFEVTQQMKIIGGIRYWRDKKTGSYIGTEPSTGVGINFSTAGTNFTSFGGPADTTGVLINGTAARPVFDDITLRAEVDYKPDPDTLIYVSYNRGSKSGGFTFSTGTPFAGYEAAFLNGIPYRPEVLDAYELGLKMKRGITSFNLAAFHYDYHNYQAFAQVGPIQSVINLPARLNGLEAEFNLRPIAGLTLQVGASFLGSKVSNILLPDLASVVEHDLPQAAGFSGNAMARYEFGLGSGTASLQADAMWTGKFCFTVLCAPVEQENGYHVENIRIGYASANNRWEVAAYVNNLFEERYRAYAFDSSLFAGLVAGVYAKPRTWGVTARMRFGAE
jgi:iron complex outermembrane receptor protein